MSESKRAGRPPIRRRCVSGRCGDGIGTEGSVSTWSDLLEPGLQPSAGGLSGELGSAGDSEFAENAAQVGPHRAGGDDELVADRLVAEPACGKRDDGSFCGCEAVPAGARAASAATGSGRVGDGLGEVEAGALGLCDCLFLVTQ
jgi:hypothetical protein